MDDSMGDLLNRLEAATAAVEEGELTELLREARQRLQALHTVAQQALDARVLRGDAGMLVTVDDSYSAEDMEALVSWFQRFFNEDPPAILVAPLGLDVTEGVPVAFDLDLAEYLYDCMVQEAVDLFDEEVPADSDGNFTAMQACRIVALLGRALGRPELVQGVNDVPRAEGVDGGDEA